MCFVGIKEEGKVCMREGSIASERIEATSDSQTANMSTLEGEKVRVSYGDCLFTRGWIVTQRERDKLT